MKLVFWSHALDVVVVLSVMDKAQSPWESLSARMSIHGVIIASRCSSRLFEARN